MAYNFNKTKAQLNEISDIIEQQRKIIVRAKKMLQDGENALAAIPGTYGGLASEIDAYVAANPGDAAAVRQQEDKDNMLADRAALITIFQGFIADGNAYDVS